MQTPTQSQPLLDGLGNHVYLEKQDRLRDIGIDIHTSQVGLAVETKHKGQRLTLGQIVVVGGQSSGKSSLLENLTGFSFPRGQGLCTRYATQITLRRSQIVNTAISITPGPHSNPSRKERLRAFRYDASDFRGERLANIIDEVSFSRLLTVGLYADGASRLARSWAFVPTGLRGRATCPCSAAIF